MKKWLVSLAILLFSIVSLFNPINGYATSWIKLSANEVIDGAEVVVQGGYDLSGIDRKMADSRMWIPFKFRVDRYYRGSGSDTIETAIQPFDMGWVKEFQENNGVFILFLKRDNQNGGLLIPVGGPNGMVQLLNGTIHNQSSDDMTTFNGFLESQALVTPIPSQSNTITHFISAWYWFILGLALVLGVLLSLLWLMLKRKSP